MNIKSVRTNHHAHLTAIACWLSGESGLPVLAVVMVSKSDIGASSSLPRPICIFMFFAIESILGFGHPTVLSFLLLAIVCTHLRCQGNGKSCGAVSMEQGMKYGGKYGGATFSSQRVTTSDGFASLEEISACNPLPGGRREMFVCSNWRSWNLKWFQKIMYILLKQRTV